MGDRVTTVERTFTHSFTVRDSFPTVPIPLTEEEPELAIDLQAVFAGVYGRSRYHQRIDYGQPLPPPNLEPADQAWVEQLLAVGEGN
ncbi:MAG: DUF4058 family protein [Alkalinema sp. RU_4_3]|nr:DUF4058 family protein [Alkalinema sp. RU_4_3]